MKADRFVLMGHSLGAVCCQLYLANVPKRKFDALVLTGSAILRHYRNSSDLDDLAPHRTRIGLCRSERSESSGALGMFGTLGDGGVGCYLLAEAT